MWEDSRGVVRGSAEEARRHAFSDDAKQRVDEQHHVTKAPRVRSRSGVLVAVGVATLLLVGGGVYAATRAGGPAAEAQPDSGSPTPSPSGTDSSAPPEEPTVEDTAPTGVFAANSVVVRVVPANGKSDPVGTKADFTWTFAPGKCDGSTCTGKLTSSSGAVYRYAWDGVNLTLKRPRQEFTAECVDESGKVVKGSNVDVTYDYELPQPTVTVVDGNIQQIKMSYWRRSSYANWVGGCEPDPRDERAVRYRITADATG